MFIFSSNSLPASGEVYALCRDPPLTLDPEALEARVDPEPNNLLPLSPVFGGEGGGEGVPTLQTAENHDALAILSKKRNEVIP